VAEACSLTPTSYVVLGLVGRYGPCTSYDMKQVVSGSIGYFWSFPHSQLYAEPARLVVAGLLDEQQEPGGRRRRTYTLTDAGREQLAAWLATPSAEPTEIRDLPLLQLFFADQADAGAVTALAEAAAAAHRARLAEYEAMRARRPPGWYDGTPLDLGIRYERTVAAFWEEVAGQPVTRPTPRRSSQ
jgi:DNA-binding PadR family transcriptional regulator